jgi:hypothetical protein
MFIEIGNIMAELDEECPLCMEPLEIDDLNFFPCTCGYQICRFCWHRIRTDENGLCPACRKAYSENPADFKPLSQEELHNVKKERKQKETQRRQKLTESKKYLASVRVVQVSHAIGRTIRWRVGLCQGPLPLMHYTRTLCRRTPHSRLDGRPRGGRSYSDFEI